LGQVVDQNGICPNPEKVATIQNVKSPGNVGDIRWFLEMVNHLSTLVERKKATARIAE